MLPDALVKLAKTDALSVIDAVTTPVVSTARLFKSATDGVPEVTVKLALPMPVIPIWYAAWI